MLDKKIYMFLIAISFMNENEVIEGVAGMYWHIAKRSPAASGLLRQCPFAALIRSGSSWPPGSLLILAKVMLKH
ncbi:hypothetical protein EHZ86_00465 [Aeromonas australiensis]|uniref:hypothetical protein n=1 Tax=Aeromonas australiensis TaxID=1114880 RepID=UPI001F35E4AB|nr:hypothetical protein [Aeromonas australiensis]MCF3095828.1 hypothetical protein [Aeromonas australiensis]